MLGPRSRLDRVVMSSCQINLGANDHLDVRLHIVSRGLAPVDHDRRGTLIKIAHMAICHAVLSANLVILIILRGLRQLVVVALGASRICLARVTPLVSHFVLLRCSLVDRSVNIRIDLVADHWSSCRTHLIINVSIASIVRVVKILLARLERGQVSFMDSGWTLENFL